MGYLRKRYVASLLALVAIGLTGCVGVHNATQFPLKHNTSVRLPDLPAGHKPIRIALLSDIHVGNFIMEPTKLAAIVEAVNRTQPDIVVLAGDFVIGASPDGAAKRALDLAPLSKLEPKQGAYAVLGNHDHWTDLAAIRANLEKAGVIVLHNDAVRIGDIALVGIGDRFSGNDNIAQSMRRARTVGGVPVAVTHSPDIASDLPDDVPVLLAGHTHCGQMLAPVIGPIVRYSRGKRLYNQKYRCGRIEADGKSVIVTAGVGSGALPLRFGTKPDWWLIELGSNHGF